jgi:hypothetical protein
MQSFRGVTFETRKKTNRPWRSVIYKNGKNIHIDYFQTFEEAKAARIKAEAEKDNSKSDNCPMTTNRRNIFA